MKFHETSNPLESLYFFQEICTTHTFTEAEIFSYIAYLDRKFQGDPEYKHNINGIICNIGSIQKHKNVLNYAAKRLKELIISEPSSKLWSCFYCVYLNLQTKLFSINK